MLGSVLPTWVSVRPFLNLGAASSSPETNCEEALASISSSPPKISPVEEMVKGRVSGFSAVT